MSRHWRHKIGKESSPTIQERNNELQIKTTVLLQRKGSSKKKSSQVALLGFASNWLLEFEGNTFKIPVWITDRIQGCLTK